MVSDDEFPSTQNKYRDDSPTDENSDVILNDILDLEEETRNKANFQMNFDFKSDRFSDIFDFEEDNNLLIQASQEIEKNRKFRTLFYTSTGKGCTRIRCELETYQHHQQDAMGSECF